MYECMFKRLQEGYSQETIKALTRYGVAIYNEDGSFKDTSSILKELFEAMEKMDGDGNGENTNSKN